jgi:anti-sigma factor RsiW
MNVQQHPPGHVLQAYHHDELDPSTAAEVAAHCEGCATCREELTELEQMERLLAGDPTPELPRTVWHRVRPDRTREPRFKPIFAVAACAAGVILGVLIGPLSFALDESSPESAWSETMSVWSGEATVPLLGVFQSGQE